jgi:predicted ATP-grasp superfamily ATP-dependent carboligase
MNLNEIIIDTRDNTSAFLYLGNLESRINTLEEDCSISSVMIQMLKISTEVHTMYKM